MRLPNELLQFSLELTGSASAICDAAGEVAIANGAWRRLAGAGGASANETAPATIRRALAEHPKLGEIEAGVDGVIAGARDGFVFEPDPCGVEPKASVRCQSVLANDGRWTVICIGGDESAPKRALRGGELSARSGTEHEMRNSLNAVIGFAQLLTSGVAGPLNEKQAQYAELILRQGQQALDRLTELLAAME